MRPLSYFLLASPLLPCLPSFSVFIFLIAYPSQIAYLLPITYLHFLPFFWLLLNKEGTLSFEAKQTTSSFIYLEPNKGLSNKGD
jgi:hypothetical protein